MTWGKSVLLTIPLVLSGIFVVAAPASATTVPTQITAATDWKSVSAGTAHTCAIRSIGKLYCWGNDDNGQLGNGTAGSRTWPMQITTATDWKSVSAGTAHTCAIRSIGKLYCWGNDDNGQLGNGTAGPRNWPMQITTATDWKTVSAGTTHTCATRGKLYCWGNDDNGQLGNGTAGPRNWPMQITTATDWKTVSAGTTHTCATRGKLYCWGNDDNGQLGNGSGDDRTTPGQITTATDWTTVSAGTTHTCATRGKLYCWGNDTDGQLGNGSGDDRTTPGQITTATDWTTVSAGTTYTCATRGKLYCWGNDDNGQLGNGSGDDRTTPGQITTATDWTTVSAGATHTCATRGKLYCWGSTDYPPADSKVPAQILDLSHWKLQTPVDTAEISGNPDEIKYGGSPDLANFTDSNYFYSNSVNDAVHFRARTDGVTTSGSSYPRSELREMTQDGQYEKAAWSSLEGTHTMTVIQAITHLPEIKPHVVAGQIHDRGDDVVMIRLEGSRLFVEADGDEKGTLDSSYTLGEKFTLTVTADINGIDVVYDPETGSTVTINDIEPPNTNDEEWYFKAGAYTQACQPLSGACESGEFGTGYGEVLVYRLEVTHS